MQIRQAIITAPSEVSIISRDLPALEAGQALIQVESCGICGSDLSFYLGKHPVIKPPIMFGHEVIGTVEKIQGPSASGFVPGDRVAFLPQVGCGECWACKRGHERLCPNMKLIGGQVPGGMADKVIVPVSNLILVPAEVPVELRVLAEPLAVGVHAAGRARLTKSDRCLVIGAGPIGLLQAFVIRGHGVAEVIVAETDGNRANIAAGFGFVTTHAIDEGTFDVAFDCVGGAVGPQLALSAVHPGGIVILVGVAARELTLNGMLLQRQERLITGSHMYQKEEFEQAFDLLAGGLIPTDSGSLASIFERRQLGEVGRMMSSLEKRTSQCIKLVVDFPKP